MPGQMTETNVLAAEMQITDPKLPVLFDRYSKFYSHLEKRPVTIVSGIDMKVVCELRPGGDFGLYDSNGGDMGNGTGPQLSKSTINTVDLKIAFQWTSRSEWVADDKRKSSVDTFRKLVADNMKEFRKNVDSLCMSDDTGTLATVSAVSVNSPVGFDTLTLQQDGFRAKLLRYGQKVDVFTPSVGTWVKKTGGGPLAISFYDVVNSIVQIPTGSGIAVSDVLVVEGTSTNPPTSLRGVKYFDSNSSIGTMQGNNRATTPEIRAVRVQATGPLSVVYPRLLINSIGNRVGEDNVNNMELWTHPAQMQSYEQIGQQLSVINKGDKEEGLNLYFGKNMSMAGMKINYSFSWDRTRIDAIDLDNWGRAVMHEPGFYKDKNGRYVFEMRGASGGVGAAWIFYVVASFNIFVRNGASLGYIDSLPIPSGY